MALMQRAQIPVLIAQEDTYDVATLFHDLIVKIRPGIRIR